MPVIRDLDRKPGQRPRVSVQLAAGQKSEVYGFDTLRAVSIALHPDANSEGVVMVTLSSPDDVAADRAKWLPWSDGYVSVPTADVLDGPFTAFQAQCTKGTLTFEAVR